MVWQDKFLVLLQGKNALYKKEHTYLVIVDYCLHFLYFTVVTFSTLQENDNKTVQVSSTNSQEKLDSLHVTFDIVCGISGSTKNSLITKQELFHNILANNLEIEETGTQLIQLFQPFCTQSFSKLYLLSFFFPISGLSLNRRDRSTVAYLRGSLS